jgi:hypothetical protein
LEHAEELVDAYRTDDGLRYLDYTPLTPPDLLVPEDLAVTILINSRVAGTAFKAVQDHGHKVALEALPSCALEDADAGQRQAVCDVICTVVAWPGFAASVATKVLHKKRPALIPILDNEAIFGAHMSPTWPERRASMDSVYAPTPIREALDWIWFDLTVSRARMSGRPSAGRTPAAPASSCSTSPGGCTSALYEEGPVVQ